MLSPRSLAALFAVCLVACVPGGSSPCKNDADCPTGSYCNTGQDSCFRIMAPAIETQSLPEAIIGERYSVQVRATGGTPPLSFALTSRPEELMWLEIDSATGEIHGTVPNKLLLDGRVFAVTVTDSEGRTERVSLTLIVRACREGEAVDCFLPEALACHQGQQHCRGGVLSSCETVAASADRSHCGETCGACANSADRCTEGACACGENVPCTGAFPNCCPTSDRGSLCVNLNSDLHFCGACNTACDTQRQNVIASCLSGKCDYACAPNFARCASPDSDGCETHLLTSPQHCGSCGKACPAEAANAVIPAQPCQGGQCQITCNTGFLNCNGGLSDGCEINSRTDNAHCGGCGVPCTAPARANAQCSGGSCQLSCQTSFGNCDGDWADGCETDLRDTFKHCGACGRSCPAKHYCGDGVCIFIEIEDPDICSIHPWKCDEP